MIIVT
jgi:hypothetical protein